MENYLKMPLPLTVLGVFFAIIAILQIIYGLKRGYAKGSIRQFIILLKLYKVQFIIGLISVLFLILFVDKPVAILCTTLYNVKFYTAVDFICSCGEGWFVFGALCLFLTSLQIFNYRHNAIILINISLIAAIYAGLLNGILKFILNRQRPSIGIEPLNFFHFFLNGSTNLNDLFYAYNSMPSGHTITVVAAIMPFIIHTKRKSHKVLLGLIPFLELFSRVYTMNHWLSDVTLASLWGVFIGIACYRANQHRFTNNLNKNITNCE